jgi:hypothetical protein
MILASPVRAARGKNKCDPGAGTTRSVGQTAVGMLRRQGAVGSSSLEAIRLLDIQALRRSAVPGERATRRAVFPSQDARPARFCYTRFGRRTANHGAIASIG